MIPIHATYVSPEANVEIEKVLRSTFLSEGSVVRSFEQQLESELMLKNCVTVNSGTSALHLALVLAGVKEGDEVILPAQTFVATGLVIVQQKALPVFADIDYNTGNLDVESIRQKITPQTKAIIPVHWGGYPCDMDEIIKLGKEHNITVVEDAAHALGALYKGRAIGSLSDYTCFSFQAIKHLTTGDGGAVCTPAEKYRVALARRWFGIDRSLSNVSDVGERVYNLEELGYKYHLNDYSAALGIANLRGFKDRLKRRIEIAELYRTKLAKFDGITLYNYNDDRQSSYWLFGLHVQRRIQFIHSMKARGIATSVVHQRIDGNIVFGGLRNDLVNQEAFDQTQINIPIHDQIDVEKAMYIVEAIKAGW